MKKVIIMMAVGALTLLGATGYAVAGDAVGYDVKAQVSSATSIAVGIQKVVGTTQTPGQQAVDFGQLNFDPGAGIFRADAFYIVDVGVFSNAANWTITHGATAVNLLGSTASPIPTLSNKINVTFVKVVGTTETQLTGGYISYANSNNYTTLSSALTGGNLRIYYGIGGGTGDAVGVVPVPSNQPSGNYIGRVTLTLTP